MIHVFIVVLSISSVFAYGSQKLSRAEQLRQEVLIGREREKAQEEAVTRGGSSQPICKKPVIMAVVTRNPDFYALRASWQFDDVRSQHQSDFNRKREEEKRSRKRLRDSDGPMPVLRLDDEK